jgi:hypothetical protein
MHGLIMAEKRKAGIINNPAPNTSQRQQQKPEQQETTRFNKKDTKFEKKEAKNGKKNCSIEIKYKNLKM